MVASGSSWTKNVDSPQVVAAALSALVAVVAAVLAARTASQQRRLAVEDRELRFREAQLNNLYGPLLMLRAASSNFRSLLPAGPPQGTWRTVDHIEELHDGSHEIERETVGEILALGKRIEDLITQQAGLFEDSPARDAAAKFVAHSGQLRMYWDAGKNEPQDGRLPFPSELDEHLAADVRRIRTRLNALRRLRRHRIRVNRVLVLVLAVAVAVLITYLVAGS